MGSCTNVKCGYVSRCQILLDPKILRQRDSTKKDFNYGCRYLNPTLMKNKLTLNINMVR